SRRPYCSPRDRPSNHVHRRDSRGHRGDCRRNQPAKIRRPQARAATRGGRRMKIIAVTACPTGIAHTYMAAEQLEKTAKTLGHQIKVETQGAMGIENELSP